MSTFYNEGRYRCEVTQQAMSKASTGTPQFVLKVRVLEMYASPSDTESLRQQYERSIYRAITEKTVTYLKKDLDVLGFSGGSLKQIDPTTPGYQRFVGTLVDCLCKHEADNKTGDMRERWSLAWPAAESSEIEARPLAPQEYRQLDALFGAAVKANGGQRPAPQSAKREAAAPAAPAKQPAPANDWPSDDDLPF